MAVEVFKLFGSIFVNNDEANNSLSKTDSKASSVASTLGKGAKVAAKFGTAIVGGATAAAGGMMKMAQSSAATADTIDKMSQKIGVSRQAYQELNFICSQSGTSVDKLQGGMKNLRSAMDNDKNAEIFRNLGVELTDAEGKMKSSEAVMWETMNALQGIADQDEKAALAQQLFGKTGSELMPLLNGQAGSIEEMKNKAHELGLVMSDELIDSGVGLTDSLDQTKRAFSAIITQLGAAFMPIVKKVSDKLQSALPYIQQAINELAPIIGDFFENILPPLFELGETLLPVLLALFQELLPVFQNLVTTILPILIDIIQQLEPLFVQILQDLLPPLLNFIQQLAPIFAQLVQQTLPLIVQLIQQILPFLVEIANTVLPILLQFLQAVLPIATQIISNILPILIDLLGKILPPILQLVQSALPVLQKIFEAIMPLVSRLSETLLPILINLFELLSPLLDYLADAFGNGLASSINTVGQAISPFLTVLQGVIDFITGVFQGDWESAWNGIVEVFKGIFNLIPTFVESVINGVIACVNGIIDGINWVAGWTGVHIDNIPEVELPRFRAGIDFVPSDKYLAYLDAGEAVLTASEAEEYRKAKRENGTRSPFKTETEASEPKIVNQTFNITVNVEKIDDRYDIDELAVLLSERLAEEVREREGVYA